jgi:uncharacterized membrane protein
MKLKNVQQVTIFPMLLLAMFMVSCKGNAQHKENEHSEKKGHEIRKNHDSRERGEHDGKTTMMRNAHERDYEGGKNEEDGTQLQKNETYNVTKKGIQLVLKFDENSNAFKGYMQNKSNKVIERARVEIHLSNGKELGPTKPINLKPNQKQELTIKATQKAFSTWITHAEVGNNEHSHEGNEGNGHEGRERSEHQKN